MGKKQDQHFLVSKARILSVVRHGLPETSRGPVVKARRVALRLACVIAGIAMPMTAQTMPPKETQPQAPGLQQLTAADARHAGELDKAIGRLAADRWDEAIVRARDQLALRAGPRVEAFPGGERGVAFESVGQVATMPNEDRIAYNSSIDSSCRQSFPLTVSHEIQSWPSA